MYAPTQRRYKVYINDEAHKLTIPAFNALLKTLEEPPAHAVFVLATTQPEASFPPSCQGASASTSTGSAWRISRLTLPGWRRPRGST